MRAFLALAVCLIVCTAASETQELLHQIEELLESDLKDHLSSVLNDKTTAVKPPRAHLACPEPKSEFPAERTEKNCRVDTECGNDEKCCDWYQNKHCLKGIDITPRTGNCPHPNGLHDFCLAGHVSCQYDNECHGEDEKCCLNLGCGYQDCQSVRQNIACPRQYTINTNETTKSCTKDTECELNEKCCDVNNRTMCITGVDTTPKRGLCPAPVMDTEPDCADFTPECEHDSECPGINDKCCNHGNCHGKCVYMNRDFSCPVLSPTPTNDTSSCSPDHNTCVGFGIICCATGINSAQEPVHSCTQGVIHTPKPGQCPDPHLLYDPHGECLTDYAGGCHFDSECWGDHKCCETACGYSACLMLPKPNAEVGILKRFLDLLKGAK